MKTLFTAFVALLLSTSAFAASGDECPSGFWDEVNKVAMDHVNGGTNLQISGPTATFSIAGQAYSVEILESPYSDGGDLNDVLFVSLDGRCQAELRNIPAYGSLLRAMGVEIGD